MRANCNIHGWSGWQTLGEQPSGCLVATATYGSEITPQVQFLRGFRDHTVLSTFAGSSFMTAFNLVYYTFSPSVASFIAEIEPVRNIMKVALYPLMGILHISAGAFSLFSFNPELGVVAAGLVASAFIGLVYITPLALILCLLKKYIPSLKLQRWTSVVWMGSIVLMITGVVTEWSTLTMATTSVFVLTTMSLPALFIIIQVTTRHIR
ncbi:MAG: hypothetical protein JSV76_03720 [Candidatus Bathyarchaeota archaeon]|nr:MAG: hypothetical protein JSV76_03720 [Candidatus Bathyarchaeota archaeon]